MKHLNFPTFDGTPNKFETYRYDALALKHQCSTKDYKFFAPKLISQFTGQIKDDFRNIDLDISRFANSEGIELLLLFLKERLHITDYSFEVKALKAFFRRTERRSGESMHTLKNNQEASYRKLQSVMNDAMRNGEDEYSDEDGTMEDKDGRSIPKFRLPK